MKVGYENRTQDDRSTRLSPSLLRLRRCDWTNTGHRHWKGGCFSLRSGFVSVRISARAAIFPEQRRDGGHFPLNSHSWDELTYDQEQENSQAKVFYPHERKKRSTDIQPRGLHGMKRARYDHSPPEILDHVTSNALDGRAPPPIVRVSKKIQACKSSIQHVTDLFNVSVL